MHKVMVDFKNKKYEGGGLLIEGYANPATQDRQKETLLAKNWRIENYKKNPILLFNHGKDPYYGQMPIGKTVSIDVKEDGIYVKCLISGSKTERITAIRDLVEEGILKTFSVGFDPKEDGTNELLEISTVPIPMHPDAGFSLSQKSISASRSKAARKWFEKYKSDQQKICIANQIKNEKMTSLELVSISVPREKIESIEKTKAYLKNFGYEVDDFNETDNDVFFMQIKDKINDDHLISAEIEKDITAHMRYKAMEDKKPMEKEKPQDQKPMEEEKGCGDKKKEKEMTPEMVAFMGDCKATAEDGEGNPASWVADEGKWNEAKKIADESMGRDNPERYWAFVTWLYLNKLGGGSKSENQKEGEPTTEKSKNPESTKAGEIPQAPTTPIPTGPNAVPANQDPSLELLKQVTVLLGSLIMETQKTNQALEKLIVEPVSDYNEPMDEQSEQTSSGQIQGKSINSNNELEITIKKLEKNHEIFKAFLTKK